MNYNVFNQLPKTYHVKILLQDFNAEVGREEICKPNSHEISNDNEVRVVNFCHIRKSDC